MRYFLVPALSALALATAPAAAQEVSGGFDFKNRYVLEDLYVLTPEPVIQPYAAVTIGDTGCELSTWASLGIRTEEGNEIDLGGSCNFNLAENTTASVTAMRYFLANGVADMTELTAGVTHGPIEISTTYYQWDHNPDAWRIQAGYTVTIEKIDVRGSLLYQTGFGDPDIVVAGLSATRPLTEDISASIEGYVPVVKASRDEREAQLIFTLGLSF